VIRSRAFIDWRTGSGVLIVIGIHLLLAPQGLAEMIDPFTDPSGVGSPGPTHSVHWDHWSLLTVTETITNIGNGQYRYAYSFVNVETSPIWDFVVFIPFVPSTPVAFNGHTSWFRASDPIRGVYPEYDGRNLNPAIIQLLGTCTAPLMDPGTAIQVGESASGFSFVAPAYDPSPKYYCYETILSGYTQSNGTGNVAAVGLTPEPASLSLLALAGMAMIWRRR
jgi:hypothetical protein